ncbi:hypothetical protein B0J14DRAFT_69385 [Halenospora varia]|nr:hypothetical protein B0J14DRAFT_69385 [Halenospora varia]
MSASTMSESVDLTVSQAREIVLEFAQGKGWVEQRIREKTDPDTQRLLRTIEKIQEELGDAVETIARDIGSKKARFILEMIQNAEDNKFTRTNSAPEITFEVFPDKIIVQCNENGFEAQHVESICRTGRSSKRSSRGYIGEKGIGFKSVFQVASKVHIQSNSFSFSFQYAGGTTSQEKLGIITPIPEDEVIPSHQRPLTRMTLTPIHGIPYSDLINEFREIPDDLLLFLSTLKRIQITIHDSDQKISITTFQKSEDSEAQVVKLTKTIEDPDNPDERVVIKSLYRIAKREIPNLPLDNARPDIHECEVVLAFPVDPDDNSRPLISPQQVFAFLPIRHFGFNFLIQADFILEASRSDVVDSPRNKRILEGVAETFRDAVVEFCSRDSRLRYRWMRYLPSREGLDYFWKALPLSITRALYEESILYPHMSSRARLPRQLRTLPDSHLDLRRRLPLFEDLESHRKYLSLEYDSRDIQTLAEAFDLHHIMDEDMYDRIKEDLESSHSKMTAADTDDYWHSCAADLISTIFSRSRAIQGRMKRLSLIPLINGQWTNALADDLYFPSSSGPEIPADLMVTVDPRAVENTSRKSLFIILGVTRCSPEIILDRVWNCYLRGDGATDISSSKAHLKYLFWHNESIQEHKYALFELYATDGRKAKPRQKVLYFLSEDEYSPEQLLKDAPHPRAPARIVQGCQVPFLNHAYLDLFPPSTRRGRFSWLSWLERALGVRSVPRLKTDGGALSYEFRYIIEYRPKKLIGTLKRYWSVYRNELNDGGAIVDAFREAEVSCQNNQVSVLQKAYAPLPSLKDKVQRLGVSRGFPFLEIDGTSEEIEIRRDWRFLEEFGVGFTPSLSFQIEILRQHEARRQRPWDNTAQTNILETYEAIAEECRDNDKDWLQQVIDESYLILDPCSFQSSAAGPSWIDIESCVWQGPENLLDKQPLAVASQYRDNEKLAHFFHRTLDIRNANWEDYLRVLSNIKNGSNLVQDTPEKVSRLYELLSEVDSRRDRANVRNSFEDESLILVSSTNENWFSPSQCLWTSPVQIEGKAIIGNSYPERLKNFFLDFLEISPASLCTLVLELLSLTQRRPSISRVKELIWAINAMDPEPADLETLLTSDILPVRILDGDSSHIIILQAPQSDLAINDRNKLARVFQNTPGATILDFTLEEVLQLEPFLQALGLQNKYLSSMYDEETACGDEGVVDNNLTEKFRERAYDLLRCAASYQSPHTRSNPQSLYNQLLGASIRQSERISTKHTLHLASENIQVLAPEGYVHVAIEENGLKIFVPRNRKDREICYLTNLPGALVKVFGISKSAREIIGNVLKSSLFAMDHLLETEGIGRVFSITPPPRVLPEESEQEALLTTEEATAASRNSRARSAPLLSSGRTRAISPVSGPEDREPALYAPGADVPDLHLGPPSEHEETSRPSTAMSDYRGTPASSGFRDPTPHFSPEPVPRFARSPTPEIFQQENLTRNSAYRELLDHVIRIGGRTTLPHRDFIPQVGNGQVHQGFDHEAAFGIRTQTQMAHDIKIGAAGELFVFEILLGLLPSLGEAVFGRRNWKSSIRQEVAVHPSYSDLTRPPGVEIADIVYRDRNSILTELLIEKRYLEDVWTGARPKYLIEVKTTTGECNDRLFMSNTQYLRMQRMALSPGRTAAEIYVVFRVYNLTKSSMNVRIYVDPEAHRRQNSLVFETQSWTVRPQ